MNTSSLFVLFIWLAVNLHFHTKACLQKEACLQVYYTGPIVPTALREHLRVVGSSGGEMVFMWVKQGAQMVRIVFFLLTDYPLSISEAKSGQMDLAKLLRIQ